MCGGWIAYRQSVIRSWPTAQATVVAFDAGVDDEWQGHWYANPKITFKYDVADRQYTSSRLNPSPFNYQSESAFRTDTSNLSPGSEITVCYDPTAPEIAYAVNRGITAAPLILLGAGAFLGIMTLACLRRHRRGMNACRFTVTED
jgi:hypothetical protein